MTRSTYLVVKTGLLDLGDENVVGLAGNLHSFLSNVAEDTNSNSRAREGVTVDQRLVNAEFATNCLYNLVIEDIIQCKDQHTLTSSLNKSLSGSISYNRSPVSHCVNEGIDRK